MTTKEVTQLNAREEAILLAIKRRTPLEALAQQMKVTLRTLEHYYLKTLMLKLECESVQELMDRA